MLVGRCVHSQNLNKRPLSLFTLWNERNEIQLFFLIYYVCIKKIHYYYIAEKAKKAAGYRNEKYQVVINY